jgi:Clostripain family
MYLRMMISIIAVCIGVNAACTEHLTKAKLAEWTVMAYVNGSDNDLERPAECTLYEMLAVNLHPTINLVVQLSFNGLAPNAHNGTILAPCSMIPNRPQNIPYWQGTQRFFIRNHKRVFPTTPQFDNLGDPRSLDEFIQWARKKFPARHYLLDLWGHGEGRPQLLQLLDIVDMRSSESYDQQRPGTDFAETDDLSSEERLFLHSLDDNAFVSMYMKNGQHILFNEEIRDILRKAFRHQKLDIIGFDACFKAMIETAYTLSDVSKVMVASEEGEPGKGWRNNDWLTHLNTMPGLDAVGLGSLLVRSYNDTYANSPGATTQSAMNLTKIALVTKKLGILASFLIHHSEMWKCVAVARAHLATYHPQFHEVDLGRFVDLLKVEANKQPKAVRIQAITILTQLSHELKGFVIQPPYASKKSVECHGSTGVAIYFPATGIEYKNDSDHKFYDPSRRSSVLFAKHNPWAKFLKIYLSHHVSDEALNTGPKPVPCF